MNVLTDVLKICVTSLVSIALLLLFCRLGGQKQISQMSMFDYINSITVGSIAAELATDLEAWWQPLTATIIYGVAAIVISLAGCKSLRMRRFFEGEPMLLYQDGKLFRKNLLHARLNLNEFLERCRMAGYFDLEQLEAAVLETSGQISFLPRADHRPATPHDLSLTPQPESLSVNLILDGKVLDGNLHRCGKDRKWLEQQLHRQNAGQIHDVFLACLNHEGKLSIFQMEDTPGSNFS